MDFPLANLDQAQLDGLLRDNPDLEDIYPLSPMQEGMLFHTLLDPDSGVYVEQLHHSFASDVDMEAFEESWRRVVARHPVLRTTFHWQGLDAPVQVVHREVRLEWVREDWSGLSTTDRMDREPDQEADQELAHRLDEYLDADRRRGFDLSKAPPMRIALIHTGGNRFEFIWSHHHAILDGWSVPILFSEIGNFYEAIRQGLQYEPPPPRPYREYIAWLQEQDRDAARDYWKRVLQGFTAATPLTVDRPHKGAEGHGERHTLLSAESTVALESFARANRITLNTLVQAAWALLLSRYSGETDVVFGVIVSGRPEALPGVESMLGLFINALPLRVSLAERSTERDMERNTERNRLAGWLQKLQRRQLEDREYGYSSLAEIQHLSEIPAGLPLFESLLVFQNYPQRELPAEERKNHASSSTRAVERTSYPLTAIAAPGEELLLRLLYDRARFDEATIMRTLGHWRTLWKQIANPAGPPLKPGDLSLLTATERQQLAHWNHNQTEYPA